MTPNRIQDTFSAGGGILRLLPAFVPFKFNQPGGRLHLHPDDTYPLGLKYGSVQERWFCSTLHAYGKDSEHPEIGFSYVAAGAASRALAPLDAAGAASRTLAPLDAAGAASRTLAPLDAAGAASEETTETFPFQDAVEELGADLIGESLIQQYGAWPMHAKFFDYRLPLFHHLHLADKDAARLGWPGKPEAYYYPVQLNNYPGEFPLTYFGFDPSVTREQVKERLRDWEHRDTRITELSRAFRIELGTGWYTPPGVLHAPGSYLTYEPQWNSLVGAVFENISSGEINSSDGLARSFPPEDRYNLDAILGLLDWEKNIDPQYREHYFRPPLPCPAGDPRFSEKWITYANPYFSAKELAILPGQQVRVTEPAAYGCVVIQGHGEIGPHAAEAPGLLRYGQQSADEFFVSEPAARDGVIIKNHSKWEPLVMLKHFGPNHPDAPREIKMR